MTSFRTLLVWLLLLAIPLQGFAVASSALCEAARTAVASQVAASMDEGHCHQPDSPAKCSNCAFCCVGMAIAPAFAALADARAPASEAIAYAAMHVTEHIPGGLERPPHSPIA
ncbi:hypothetical protein PO883_08810 [Massilia sp. DJPM01]|uniref:hypothetical protein n=1 Tax=Massilia sp. DJPM01 TaxID=3024404 RepID=UPI00259F1829|nr:hypothetical protein [Massilia sp. DJPM01]MDM5177293.1 hypothetical protein [Massilia sp. DJPM01]